MLLLASIICIVLFFRLVNSTDTVVDINEEYIVNTAPENIIENAIESEKECQEDWIKIMTASYVLANFNWEETDINAFTELKKHKSIKKILGKEYKKYKGILDYHYTIYSDIADVKKTDGKLKTVYKMYYPIPQGYNYDHHDDFGAVRTYGGDRKHMGNDIMAQKGIPIISVTDGIVEKMGWNELGGWRIGITDSKNKYWYYAHMSKYAEEIEKGSKIKAGDIIGYIGNSGYGPEGTVDQFDPHLHIQVGINSEDNDYLWIDPNGILKFIEKNKVIKLNNHVND